MIEIKDPWFTVQQIDKRTFAISEYGHWEKVHSYLLIGDHKAALIDTGLGIDSIKRITNQLTNLPIIVLTTHVHWDHIGNHGEFEQLYVHKDDAEWLIEGIKGLSLEQIRKDIGRDIIKPTPQSFNPKTYRPFTGPPTGLLNDKDEIELGERMLTILHTPGHSPGHISIFDHSTGYLFTGDLLYDKTPIYAFYPTTDPVKLVESLKKIAQLPKVSKIYGGHNTIGLPASMLVDVEKAVQELEEKELVKFGTGIHQFNSFSVHF